jgi:pyruvate/2-oxoglutarate dehydrogenase complex dihydrolipoamide acyltransferase (E2) component
MAPANGRVKASPLAKQLAEEKGIDIGHAFPVPVLKVE